MAVQVKDSEITAIFHECDQPTNHLWTAYLRGEVRACSQKCADDYESGDGSEPSEDEQLAHELREEGLEA